jgi:two-component system NtrC family sensor kinase
MSPAQRQDEQVPAGAGAATPRAPDEERALARLARAIAPRSLGDLGFEIPWSQRLSTRLLGMVGVVAFVTVGAFFLAEIGVQRHLLAQVVAESDLLSQTMRNAMHRAMLQDRREDAYAIMEDIGRQPGIEKVRLIDENGRVTFSTESGERGKLVDREAEACSGCHLGSGPIHAVALDRRSRTFTQDGRRKLGIVTAFHNEPSCSTAACHVHGPERKVLGVVDVSLSLARLDEETRGFRWISLLVAAAVAMALALFVWFFSRREVIQPVAALLQATRRVARDQLELEIPVTWSGELGLLAASFNDMTRGMRAARAEVDRLMHTLERQVQERTAALEAAQDQLVRNEKLSSLGKLAASIAHEINNPLAGILTFAKLLVRNLDQGLPDEATRKVMVKNLLLVQRETERCSAIVRNLLDFSRERPLTVVEVDLIAVVDEALQLLANQIHIQGITIDRRLPSIPRVQGDFGQLRQACVNVIMNACEAMARGGRLTIESSVMEGGKQVELAFTDTGPGIAPDVLSKIFDPFFTTKERGTGLGLSVVYGIVERHGGKIELRSEVGKGTRVALRLPPRGGDVGLPPRKGDAGGTLPTTGAQG